MSCSPLAALDSAKFSGVLRSRFQVRAGASEPVELELAEVTPERRFGAGSAGAAEYESFSVLFEGPDTAPLGQGTYSFKHARLGNFDLFIVPVGHKGQKIQYQAVFNRAVTAG